MRDGVERVADLVIVMGSKTGALHSYHTRSKPSKATLVTKPASDEFEARLRVGADSGPGYEAQGAISGPMSDNWKYRASLSYSDTDGYLENTFLNTEADPYTDTSGRVRFTFEPNDNVSGDFRASYSKIDTTALYFVINNDYGLPPSVVGVDPGTPTNDPSDTSVPIRVNNPGEGIKEMKGFSMKWDVQGDNGTFTSITSYDDLDEILTGDAFDFRPPPQSFNVLIGPFLYPPTFPPNVPAIPATILSCLKTSSPHSPLPRASAMSMRPSVRAAIRAQCSPRAPRSSPATAIPTRSRADRRWSKRRAAS